VVDYGFRGGVTVQDCIHHLSSGNTEFGNQMADFIELLHGPDFAQLPYETQIYVEQIHRFSFLGDHYCDGGTQWIKFSTAFDTTTSSAAKIRSIYSVNSQIYFILDVYPNTLKHDKEGRLTLKCEPDAHAELTVALCDLHTLSGIWCVNPQAGNGKKMMIFAEL